VGAENHARSVYWVLTQDELKIVSLDHDATCCVGCCRTGDKVQTIPLENITDCGKDAQGKGSCNKMVGDLPSIYVDTASVGGNKVHEAFAFALKDNDRLIASILNQRDAVKGGLRAAPVAQAMLVRGDDKPAKERLAEIQDLLYNGVITQQEYDQKRKDILSSI
jgi:hypothetical protein